MKLFITAPENLRKVPETVGIPAYGRPIYFRYTFITEKAQTAKLRITALGVYEAYLDGQKIGKACLAPGWTDYRTRIYCMEHTVKLEPGKHVLSAIVADGWYCGHISSVGPCQYGETVCLWAELTLEDGTVYTTNEEDWRVGNGGYLAADLINGEEYDASKEPEGWKMPDFDDSGWDKAMYSWGEMLGTNLVPFCHPAIEEMQVLSCVSETRDRDGNYIYDLGQNMAGTVRVTFMGEKGKCLRLCYGEMLDEGSLYTANLRSAKQTDAFWPKEDGKAEFRPRFTFHGFRYVESNLPLLSIEGIVLYSACAKTGHIETSSPLVNQIYQNLTWGQRGNFLDVPTDCPQRDERMGWTGDAQIFARTGMYNMQADAFYRKYMTDLRDAMLPNGAVTNVVPHLYQKRGRALTQAAVAAWGDAVFIIPYHHWMMYGDRSVLAENYDAMKRYFAFLQYRAQDFLQPDWGYGDWLNTDAVTEKPLVATAYYAYDALLLSEIATVLEREEDTYLYKTAYTAIRDAFINAYEDEDGRLPGDTQCAYTLALHFGLYTDREKTAAHLVRALADRNNHLSTGFVGTAYLMPVLSEIGRDDLAYTLLLNESFPSWGYSIAQGATTMWERWNSYTKENGFGDVSMNSFNHYSFGAVGQWMYEYMAGLRPITPGFGRFAVCPRMDARVPKVETVYRSVSGEIRIGYDIRERILKLTVPPKTVAEVTLNGKTVIKTEGEYTLPF